MERTEDVFPLDKSIDELIKTENDINYYIKFIKYLFQNDKVYDCIDIVKNVGILYY
jgi:hypothetical protein